MEFIVQTLLTLPEVKKIVVSNSNFDIPISKWIKISDPRIVLIDQKVNTYPGVRFALAQSYPSEYYLSIDDDYFLSSFQIRSLIKKLVELPKIPHGVRGDVVIQVNGNDQWVGIWDSDPIPKYSSREVDCLIGVYAFTKKHLTNYAKYAEKLGYGGLSQIHICDDIILSFCGEAKARYHNFGYIVECPSSYLKNIALHRRIENFNVERLQIFNRLKNTLGR